MCLGKVMVSGGSAGAQEIGDVVDIRTDGGVVTLSTLFGETHRFTDVAIDHIAMRSGIVVSLVALT